MTSQLADFHRLFFADEIPGRLENCTKKLHLAALPQAG